MYSLVIAFDSSEALQRYIHGGESCDILHLYSDRTGKNIRHYVFNTLTVKFHMVKRSNEQFSYPLCPNTGRK